MEKKVTASITLVSGFLLMLLNTLIGMGIIPAEASDAGGQLVAGLVDVAQGGLGLGVIFGLRKAVATNAAPVAEEPPA